MRFAFRLTPEPPPAGRVKLADPRASLRRWFFVLVLTTAALGALWSRGVGSAFDEMRCDVVAAGYLDAAERHAASRPVQREAALHDLQRAMVAATDKPQYVERAAQLYLGLRAYTEARTWLSSQPSPGPLLKVSLGQCLLMSGQPEQGATILTAGLAEAVRERDTGGISGAEYALVLNNAGYALALAGRDLPQAQECVGRALASAPLQPAFVDSMGWVEYRLGHFQDAAFYLERAARLEFPQDDAEMQYHLGMAYVKLGKLRGAHRALTRCLELDPSWSEARQELHGLQQLLPPPAIARTDDPSPDLAHRDRS
jgi:predicted Zn-dependent protease